MNLPAPVPGLATVTNLLATALLPVGRTLYVYGGGWDYADTGSGPQSTCLGLSPCWEPFFRAKKPDYDFRLYRGDGVNPYYYAGLDCSGYLGWVIYNTLCTRQGEQGFVGPATLFAKTLAQRHHLGRLCPHPSYLRCGDLFSLDGHVWLCVGRCPDGSMVILHSTPSPSVTGAPGGGVQLSALGRDHSCQAARIASGFMGRLAPRWMERYTPMVYSYGDYTAPCPQGGCFLWSHILSDPMELRQKTAGAILSLLLP